MDETTAVTKQSVEEGAGTLLRVGTREYYRYGEDPRWAAQPSGRPVDEAIQDLLDALEAGTLVELAPEEPKPLDVEVVQRELAQALEDADAAFKEEHGRPSTSADRDKLCESELAGQLYGRYDSVAVAAVREALDRNWDQRALRTTLREVFSGTQECC
jgi:hypothetical protein